MGLNGIGQVDGTRTGMCSTGQNGKGRDVTGVDEGGRDSWGRDCTVRDGMTQGRGRIRTE